MRKLFTITAVIASACLQQALAVDPPDGFTVLFDGASLAGWHGYNPHEVVGLSGTALDAKLQEMRDDFSNHWSVDAANEELVNDGSGPYACTDLDYGDMELQLEFTVGWGGDSGIYLRGNPEVQLLDRFAAYDAAKPECRPHFGSGGLVYNSPGTLGRDAMMAFDMVPFNWQTLRIVQVGARTWVYLNGKGVVEGVELENFWNPGQPLPALGPILLQANGQSVRFRNIFVRSLSLSEGAAFVSENQPLPEPDFCDVQYGPDARQLLHLWKADSSEPTPLVVYFHDGGWWGGGRFQRRDLEQLQALRDAGISYAAVAYRFSFEASREGFDPPIKGVNYDCKRALQYLRSKADTFNIDKNRIAIYGGSAGGCSGLWLAMHSEMADPNSSDPVERESTRVTCVGPSVPQTSLDPVQVLEWIPNGGVDPAVYGITAEDGLTAAEVLLRERNNLLPYINEYSPWAQISSDDPPVYLQYGGVPAMGVDQADTAHTANFGQGFYDRCIELGVPCDFNYYGSTLTQYDSFIAFAIDKLQPSPGIAKIASADTYVRSGDYADTNFGAEKTLVCKTAGGNYARESYLKFKKLGDLDPVGKAVLRLKVASGTGGDTYTAYFVSSDDWTESSITWNNKPAAGTALAAAQLPAVDSWIEFDITDQVSTEQNGDGKLSLVILSNGGNYVTYHSTEAVAEGDRPHLVLTAGGAGSGSTSSFVIFDDQTIWGWDGSNFAQFGPASARLVDIDVGEDNVPWGIDAAGTVYSWDGSDWTQRATAGQDIAVGGGKVFLTKTDDSIWEWNGSSFVSFSGGGALAEIDVGDDGVLWGINAAGSIWSWNGSWSGCGSGGQDIGVGGGNVFLTKTDDSIWEWNGSSFVSFSGGGALEKVDVGEDGLLWGINAAGNIYAWTGSSWSLLGSSGLDLGR